jgi:hypothetical protein
VKSAGESAKRPTAADNVRQPTCKGTGQPRTDDSAKKARTAITRQFSSTAGDETILPVTASPLPQGWDLRRIRNVSGDESAELLDPGCVVIADQQLGANGPVRVVAAFGFHDLAIVKLADDGGWHMGSLDRSTSAVDLWAEYDDFGDAVRGL